MWRNQIDTEQFPDNVVGRNISRTRTKKGDVSSCACKEICTKWRRVEICDITQNVPGKFTTFLWIPSFNVIVILVKNYSWKPTTWRAVWRAQQHLVFPLELLCYECFFPTLTCHASKNTASSILIRTSPSSCTRVCSALVNRLHSSTPRRRQHAWSLLSLCVDWGEQRFRCVDSWWLIGSSTHGDISRCRRHKCSVECEVPNCCSPLCCWRSWAEGGRCWERNVAVKVTKSVTAFGVRVWLQNNREISWT